MLAWRLLRFFNLVSLHTTHNNPQHKLHNPHKQVDAPSEQNRQEDSETSILRSRGSRCPRIRKLKLDLGLGKPEYVLTVLVCWKYASLYRPVSMDS